MAAKSDDGRKTIAENRKARFEFRIEDTWEAGIELTGTEVKSLRTGQANIAESYASAENGGIYLINSYIPEYKAAGDFFQHEPRRPRRLLLHKSEIHKLSIAVAGTLLQQAWAGEASAGAGPGQEAARQARRHRQARLAAPEGKTDAE
jgi:tmRNA-binding protein